MPSRARQGFRAPPFPPNKKTDAFASFFLFGRIGRNEKPRSSRKQEKDRESVATKGSGERLVQLAKGEVGVQSPGRACSAVSTKKKSLCKRLVVIRKFTKQPIDRAEQRKSVMDQKSMTDFLYASLSKICDGENKEKPDEKSQICFEKDLDFLAFIWYIVMIIWGVPKNVLREALCFSFCSKDDFRQVKIKKQQISINKIRPN